MYLGHPLGEGLAVVGQQVDRLAHHTAELAELHQRYAALPPDLARVHRHEVVKVHDGVDAAVEEDRKVDVPVVSDVEVEPIHREDGHVVIHVQKAELLPVLLHDDEEGVGEIKHLGNVEQPQQAADRRVLVVECIARGDGIMVPVCQHSGLNRHVSAQRDLDKVVDEAEGVHRGRLRGDLERPHDELRHEQIR